MAMRRRHAALLVAGTAVSALFAAAAIRDVQLDLFVSSIREMKYLWLIPALACLAAAVVLRAQRWRLVFVPQSRPPFSAALRSLLIGLFFNQILPFRAGEAARVVALGREAGTSRAEAAGTAIVERVFDVLALFVLLFAAWFFVPEVSWIRAAAIFALLFSVGLAVMIVVLVIFGDSLLRRGLAPLAIFPGVTRQRIDAAAERLSMGLRALHRPSLAAGGFLLTVLSWLVVAISYLCVFEGFGLEVGFAGAVVAVVATNLVLVIPSLPAGLGVFEAATIAALQPYSIDDSQALACAVVLHAVNFFPYLIAGVVALRSHTVVTGHRVTFGTTDA
ncbi:MAG: lysylphosphatidylglycerol synthase transmembrane domain-containing protein [Actinomycetota bacterium]